MLSITVDIFTENTLPKELYEYIQKQDSLEIPLIGYFLGGFFFVLLIISYIGIYLWQNWARFLFIFTIIFGLLPIPIKSNFGPDINTSYAQPIYSLTYILIGVSISLMFFTEDVIKKFTKQVK